MNNKRIFYVLIIITFLVMRIWGMTHDITNSDAIRWHRRSINFLRALKTRDLSSTYQHYQPGVTLMWISSISEELLYRIEKISLTSKQIERNTLENADWYPILDSLDRIFILIVLMLLFLLQIYLISKMFSSKMGYLYGILIALEPYIIGIDRWYHLTSLETYFGFTAFLCLLYWRRKEKNKYLYISAILLSFSILSKITTLILLPFFLVLIYFKLKDFRKIILYAFVCFITIFLFFPALWVNFSMVIAKLNVAISNSISDSDNSLSVPPIIVTLFYPLVIVYKLSPITLLIFSFAIYSLFKSKNLFRHDEILISLIYFFYYLILLSLPQKKIDRYVLVLIFPIVFVVSYYLSGLSKNVVITALNFSAIFMMFVIYLYHPVYSAYYSPIFGGTKKALEIGIYDNSGEYFAQAALYLNTKGRVMYTFVPNNIDAFSFYYKGNVQREFDENTNYIVRSVDIDRKTLNDSNCPTLEKSFGPKGFENIVGIFKCSKLSYILKL